jgi:hypothetical protein
MLGRRDRRIATAIVCVSAALCNSIRHDICQRDHRGAEAPKDQCALLRNIVEYAERQIHDVPTTELRPIVASSVGVRDGLFQSPDRVSPPKQRIAET